MKYKSKYDNPNTTILTNNSISYATAVANGSNITVLKLLQSVIYIRKVNIKRSSYTKTLAELI